MLWFRAYTDDNSGSNVNVEDGDDVGGGEESEQDGYDLPPDSEYCGDDVEIKIEKIGKNSRRIISRVAVRASLLTVWNILTDYERLADFIPGLAVSQLLEKRDKFARLFQVHIHACTSVKSFEKGLEIL